MRTGLERFCRWPMRCSRSIAQRFGISMDDAIKAANSADTFTGEDGGLSIMIETKQNGLNRQEGRP